MNGTITVDTQKERLQPRGTPASISLSRGQVTSKDSGIVHLKMLVDCAFKSTDDKNKNISQNSRRGKMTAQMKDA
eukprot:5394771-Amphidinium_carterae.1